MKGVALALALSGLGVGAWTGLAAAARPAGANFVDHGAYVSMVLSGKAAPHVPQLTWFAHGSSIAWAIVTLTGSFVWAVLGLYRAKLPGVAAFAAITRPLKAVHSGHVGDYVAWLTFGTAIIGGVFALTLR